MPALNYISASALSLAQVTNAFNRAFTGYYLPMTQTPRSLSAILRETDVALERSVALTVDGEVAGISLVAIRGDRAWIAGMGVDPRWRGHGYGRALLQRVLRELRDTGIRVVSLEALMVNSPAIALYSGAGFRETRELRVYQGSLNFEGWGVGVADGERLHPITWHEALREFSAFHHTPPAWQREERSIAHVHHRIQGVGLWRGAELRAYILFTRPSDGVVVYDAGARDPAPATRIADIIQVLRTTVRERENGAIRAINVAPGDALGEALIALKCPVVARQREMALDLSQGAVSDVSDGRTL